MAYFDNAATTFPKPECVYEYMDQFYRVAGGSVGRGNYGLSLSAKELVNDTRNKITDILCCPAKQVIFEPSATIALNIVLQGLVYYPVHKKEAYFTMYPILKSHGCIGCSELVDCQKARTMVMNKLLCDETEASSIILEAVPEESVETLMEAAQNTIFNDADSILVNVDSNDGNPNWEKELFYATLSSDMITNADEDFHTLSNKFLHQALEQALALLSDRESEVLRQRYGYYGREKTLEEVGQMFGITRERVRQIEAKALRKLRHPSRSKHLKDFL